MCENICVTSICVKAPYLHAKVFCVGNCAQKPLSVKNISVWSLDVIKAFLCKSFLRVRIYARKNVRMCVKIATSDNICVPKLSYVKMFCV